MNGAIVSKIETSVGRRFAEVFRSLQRRSGLLVPKRRDLTLPLLGSTAAYLNLIEIKSPLVAIVRILGTAIVNRTQVDNTGGNIFDLYPPEFQQPVSEVFQRIVQTPCGAVADLIEGLGSPITVEAVSFPFANSEGVPVYVGSVMVERDPEKLILATEGRMRSRNGLKIEYLDIGAGAHPATVPGSDQ